MPNTKPIGVAFADPELDGAVFGKSGGTAGFYGTTPVVKGAALTTQLTTLTIADAAGTPDYAIAAVTASSPYGFSNAAEIIATLYVIQNLQTRVSELETRLKAYGLLP